MNRVMKSLKVDMPDRIHKKIKQWVVNAEDELTQTELLIYIFDNIHNLPIPKVKPNPILLSALEKPVKWLSLDQRRTLELIGKGIIKPTQDEQKLADKLIKS